ncbi:SIS domain-containing protein [Paenibacillus sp. T3-5-0-4]|nr:SIS domain-containing protein [Paenibacillus endoradicis]
MEIKPTMKSYILEQEQMTTNILSQYPSNVDEIARQALGRKHWILLATGSSINAAQSARYYVEKMTGAILDVREPFHFTNYDRLSDHIDYIVGVSQSGQSTSTIGALERIKQESGLPIAAFSSDVQSAMSEVADIMVDVGCGKERVGYVTKGFTATVLTLMLTGLRIGQLSGKVTEDEVQRQLNQFNLACRSINRIITKTESFYELFKDELLVASKFTAIGYGPSVGTVNEFETKFIETVRVPTRGIELEAFMHGPYLEVNKEHRIFFIETESKVRDRMIRLKQYESKYTPYTYGIQLEASSDARTIGLDLDINEWMAPLILVIPFQVLAYHVAEDRGNNLSQRIYTDFGVAMSSKTAPGDYV